MNETSEVFLKMLAIAFVLGTAVLAAHMIEKEMRK